MPFTMLQNGKKKFAVSAELLEESANKPLIVTGIIPDWLSGTFVRNGPVNVKIDGQTNHHWFDGLAMLHAFSFSKGKVNYSNKFLRTEAYETVFDDGSLHYLGFAVDPCRSIFKSFLSFFIPQAHLPIHNANVNITKLADKYVALTEIPLPVQFDPKTLDTIGVLNYSDTLPKDRSWESAHPHHDNKGRSTINYLIKFGRKSSYTFYSIIDGTDKRKVIAEIPVDKPSYMHSFSVTENYLILTEYPFVVNPFDLLLKGKPFITNYHWRPERGTRFTIIDRHTGKLFAQHRTRPFFSFHHVNAFEKGGKIHLDIVTYHDAEIITGPTLYVDQDKPNINETPSQLERFTFSPEMGGINSEVLLPLPCEFPRINQDYDGLPYRYIYSTAISEGVIDTNEIINSTGLYKLDTTTKQRSEWGEEGCLPGEPVFISAPDATEEDDGVVLAIVADRKFNDSFLLILDGRTFKEIGRAMAPHPIPAGLHAQYIS